MFRNSMREYRFGDSDMVSDGSDGGRKTQQEEKEKSKKIEFGHEGAGNEP
jgi:hypothetical protein